MGKKQTDPGYYEANRMETGLNHIDYGRVSYCHIPKERWEEIFGVPQIRSAVSETGERRPETVGG